MSMAVHVVATLWNDTPLQCNTITRSEDPCNHTCISRVARAKSASGGTLRKSLAGHATTLCIHQKYALMVGEWVSADSSAKYARRVRIFHGGTKVEHPKIGPMAMSEEFKCVLSSISIKTLDTYCWISHYYHCETILTNK